MTNFASAVIETILSTYAGSALCRSKSNGNFVAIPTGDAEQPYVSVKVGDLLAKATKVNPAFDFDSAVAEYTAFEQAQIEKANKPKASKGVNPEAQARRDAMDAEVRGFFATAEQGKRYTVTEIANAVPAFADAIIMQVGSACKRVAESGDIRTEKGEKGKNLYFVGE